MQISQSCATKRASGDISVMRRKWGSEENKLGMHSYFGNERKIKDNRQYMYVFLYVPVYLYFPSTIAGQHALVSLRSIN